MPKSCSLRASMPIRTLHDTQLPAPTGAIEPEALQRITTGSRIDIHAAGALLGCHDRIADGERLLADPVEIGTASGRDTPLHRAWLPQRRPFAVERSAD